MFILQGVQYRDEVHFLARVLQVSKSVEQLHERGFLGLVSISVKCRQWPRFLEQ